MTVTVAGWVAGTGAAGRQVIVVADAHSTDLDAVFRPPVSPPGRLVSSSGAVLTSTPFACGIGDEAFRPYPPAGATRTVTRGGDVMRSERERIVVGVDASPLSMAALRWAVREGALRGAAVEAVHAWQFPAVAVTGYGATTLPVIAPEDLEKAACDTLDHMLAEARDTTSLLSGSVAGVVERGHPADVLTQAAKGASLLVVGSRGHGTLGGMLLGSVTTHVLHHSPCPVAVIPSTEPPSTGRVVVGVDGSPASISALRWAVHEARLREVGVDVVHAWQYPDVLFLGETAAIAPDDLEQAARDVLQETLDAVAGEATDVDLTSGIERGGPGQVLTARAVDSALVVVGSRGHGGFASLLLGSVSHAVVHGAPCPTIVVRGDD